MSFEPLLAASWGELAWNFGQDIEAVDPRRDPEFVVSVFNPHHGGLAASPLFFSEAQFSRKDEHNFEFAAFRDVLVRI